MRIDPTGRGWILPFAAAGALLIWSVAAAHDRYSINRDATNCASCHGDYRAPMYVSLADGTAWGNLHDIHRIDMLSFDCATCHGGGDLFPVLIGASDGGNGLAPLGCVGCHGRVEDGTGVGTIGYGLALQRLHHELDVGGDHLGRGCIDCHTDIEQRTPVGEEVRPPYYADPGSGHSSMPTDPCNPAGDYPEQVAGTLEGLDNDGDQAYDALDPDCLITATGPGEASGSGLPMLRVTAHDATLPRMEITYAKPCNTTGHTIEYGLLSEVSSYAYIGQRCEIGRDGSYSWNYPETGEPLFFVVVGDDGSVQGSYGVDSDGAERPPDTFGMVCPLPQDLSDRCD